MSPTKKRAPRPHIRIGALSLAKCIAALLDQPCSIYDLIDVSGMSQITCRSLVRALRQEGAAYVRDWDMDRRGGHTVKIWALGAGKDKPRPKPRERAKIERDYRSRRKMAEMLGLVSQP